MMSIDDPYTLIADCAEKDTIALALARGAELECSAVMPLSHSELVKRLRA